MVDRLGTPINSPEIDDKIKVYLNPYSLQFNSRGWSMILIGLLRRY